MPGLKVESLNRKSLNSNCIKHADNVLRGQAGYQLSGWAAFMLTEENKSLIESALQPEAPRRELSIDHSEVAQLAKVSEALRERLLAEEESVSEGTVPAEASAEEPPMEVAAKPPVKAAEIDSFQGWRTRA